MADINHTISLGIGSPAAIPEFITVGLQIGTTAVLPNNRLRKQDTLSETRLRRQDTLSTTRLRRQTDE